MTTLTKKSYKFNYFYWIFPRSFIFGQKSLFTSYFLLVDILTDSIEWCRTYCTIFGWTMCFYPQIVFQLLFCDHCGLNLIEFELKIGWFGRKRALVWLWRFVRIYVGCSICLFQQTLWLKSVLLQRLFCALRFISIEYWISAEMFMFVLRLLLVNKNPKFSKITQLFIGKLTLRHYFLLKGSSSHSFLYLLSSWSPIQFCQVRNSIVLISLSPFRSCLICLRYGRSILRFFGTFYFRAFLHLL